MKEGGLGDNFAIDEFDLGGDVGSIQNISCPATTQEVPGITARAQERLILLHDGAMSFNSYFNPENAAGAEGAHTALKALPTTDRIMSWFHGATIGNPAASLVSKQISYDGNRETSGAFTFASAAQGNAWGLDHGQMLTAYRRVDTDETDGASLDLGASPTSYSFGWSMYLHVFDFDGTDCDITIEDSANDTDWTAITDAAFTTVTDRGREFVTSHPDAPTATVRRYVRVVTTGTFNSIDFAVNFTRYEAAHA